MGGGGSLSCDTSCPGLLDCKSDTVRYFILSPIAFILGIGAANSVLPFVFFIHVKRKEDKR